MGTTGEFKDAIKALRASTGLSQRAFAEKFDIPKRTIENWEGGQTDPPGYVVKLIEKALEAEQAQGEDALTLEPEKIESQYYTVKGTPYRVTIEKVTDREANDSGYDMFDTCWVAWIHHKDYGIKKLMFEIAYGGTQPKEFKAMVEASLDQHIKTYREEVED